MKKLIVVTSLAALFLFLAGQAAAQDLKPLDIFTDELHAGGFGPRMVVIPAGSLEMGCSAAVSGCPDRELPLHTVTISQPFAVSMYEVTFEDYDRFTYPKKGNDQGWGRGRRPVIDVSWNDAQRYVAWLSVNRH